MKKWKKLLKTTGLTLTVTGFAVGVLILLLTVWAVHLFGNVSMEEILFHLKMPLNGTDPDTIIGAIVQVALPCLLLAAGFLALLLAVLRLHRCQAAKQDMAAEPLSVSTAEPPQETTEAPVPRKKKRFRRALAAALSRIPVWVFSIVSVLMLLGGFWFANDSIKITAFLRVQMQKSTFIETEYVDPKTTEITFPEQKRNLVYIFMESMEASYTSTEQGGAFEENLIPELTALAENNINFSHSTGLGGAIQLSGTSWTIAGMLAQTAGLPLSIPADGNAMSRYAGFFPGATSLGEILSGQGYRNYLMIGSDAVFGGRKNYFTQHGDYEIFDYYTAKETGKIAEDYYKFWGYEDQKLFTYAKEKLTELSQSGEPFNFTLLTVDTHFPNGYTCPLCREEHDTAYKNVLSCSSRQTAEFVCWLTEQDFYENTTIILAGDHQTMATQLVGEMPKDYVRHTYNAFINAAAMPSKEKERVFSSMDMFPTTLAALGAEIDGDRLGLGTNLFSDRQTLSEEYGSDYIDTELQKKSSFYDNELLYGTERSSSAQ